MTVMIPPFIDCHHHIWDPKGGSHPWLAPDVAIPFRYGDYSAIKGRYLPGEYEADAGSIPVVGHVTMEGEWNEADPVAESRWIANVFAERPDYFAHVARAILHAPDVGDVLAAHAAFPFVRGIRHKPVIVPTPDDLAGSPTKSARGSLNCRDWRRGYARLRRHGFHFELQAPWWHVRDLLDLISAHPETPIVLNHMFMPGTRAPEAMSGWRAAIDLAATAPNVVIKISGMGLPGRPWDLADHRPLIDHVIDRFGAERCMVASNFPVDRLCGTFETIISGYAHATVHLSNNERNALFWETAARVYRIDTRTIAGVAEPPRHRETKCGS